MLFKHKGRISWKGSRKADPDDKGIKIIIKRQKSKLVKVAERREGRWTEATDNERYQCRTEGSETTTGVANNRKKGEQDGDYVPCVHFLNIPLIISKMRCGQNEGNATK